MPLQRPHFWGLSSSWWSWASSSSEAEQHSPCGQAEGVGEMPLLPLSSPGWGWLCLRTRPGLPLEALTATAGEESISWNIYLLSNLSSWLVVVPLVEAAVIHSECDKSVGTTWHSVFFNVPDAGQWPGNTQGGRQQPPLKTHEETAAPGTWVLTSPVSCSTLKPSGD